MADAKEEDTHLMNRRVFRPEDIDRFYELDGIEISASRIQKDKPGERKSVYTSDFNRKITTEELSRMRVVDMYDLLQRVPGVGIWRDEDNNTYPYLRKYDVDTRMLPPLLNILINNQPATPDELNNYLPEYVTSIEVIADRAGALGTAYAMKKLTMAGTLLIMTSTKPVDVGSKELESMIPILPWGYQVAKEFYSPRYEVKPEVGGSSMADNRPALYWNPDIRVVAGKGGFDFYTSDYPHGYEVVMEGIADDGRLVYWHGQVGD